MLEYGLIAVATFLASIVSFYSGFGLGTILMPVVAIFLPLPVAIALTAVVHLLHNLLKLGLLWKEVDWATAIRFGLGALIFSIPGALLLKKLSLFASFKEYSFLGVRGEISWLHICIGLLFIFIATMEVFPHRTYRIRNLFLGGAISGFFGGLSGNQGALRSTFLMKTNLTTKAFIGTNAIIAVAVDAIRLVVYGLSFHHLFVSENGSLLSVAMIGGIGGVLLGMTLLKKMTLEIVQRMIVCLLYLLGALFVLGII